MLTTLRAFTFTVATATLAPMGLSQQAPPEAVVWSVDQGGNGHAYLPVLDSVLWPEARDLAFQAGGYLATPRSAAENAFIVGLIADDLSFWIPDSAGLSQGLRGPHLGGFQSESGAEPAGGWQWLTADPGVVIPWEPGDFTSWAVGEPGNIMQEQDWLVYFCKNQFTAGCGTWNDIGVSQGLRSYIIEFDNTQSFFAAPEAISLSAGGTQTLTLDGGFANADGIYFILGTISGTSPGQTFGSLELPLNPDGYFTFTLTAPSNGFIEAPIGILDAMGTATTSISLPAGSPAALAGLVVDHAYTVLGSNFVSNPVSLTLLP